MVHYMRELNYVNVAHRAKLVEHLKTDIQMDSNTISLHRVIAHTAEPHHTYRLCI